MNTTDQDKRKDRLDRLLAQVEYPGDEEAEIRAQVRAVRMPERVMRRIRALECANSSPIDASARTGALPRAARIWAAAAILNIILIILFEGRPGLIHASVGPNDFYSQLMFLFLGLTTSVSITGFLMSIDPARLIELLPAFIRK
jgi:hypothetical protein